MSFLYPEVFWLALLLVVITTVLLFVEKKSINSHFSKEIYEKLMQNNSGLKNSSRMALLVTAMLFMIVALARPVSNEQNIKINETAIDLIVALDISRSMEAEDLYPNRLLWAKKKLLDLIEKGDDLRIGVMAFAANAYVVSPLTSDQEVASYLVENLQSTSISEKGTDVLQLVDAAAKQLKEKNHKYLLLITDGGDDTSYAKEIKRAKEEGVIVFILGTATTKGAPIKEKEGGFVKRNGDIILTRLNEAIKELALKTGGVYIKSVPSAQDIDAMLAEIRAIAEDETIASSVIKKYQELFIYFLAVAFLLLVLAFASIPKRNLALIAMILFMTLPHRSYAGITDFLTIDKAEDAYHAKDFNKSSENFQALSNETPSDEAYYNLGNAYYKQKNYTKALEAYKKVAKTSPLYQKTLHNSGNAFAYDNKLDKAKEVYEQALALGEDQKTRENLDEVLKHLKKDEEKNQDKKGQDQQDQNKKEDQKENKKEDQGSKKDQKSDNNDQKQDEASKQKQGDAKEQQEQKQAAQDRKKAQKEEQEKKSKDAKASADEKKESEKVKQQQHASQKDITDKEERKLLQMLDQQKGQTYRYYVPSEHKKEEHEKPW